MVNWHDLFQPGDTYNIRIVYKSVLITLYLSEMSAFREYPLIKVRVTLLFSLRRLYFRRPLPSLVSVKGLVINYGKGGLQNGEIAGLKLCAPPPQDRVKLFEPPPPLLKSGNFSHPPPLQYG